MNVNDMDSKISDSTSFKYRDGEGALENTRHLVNELENLGRYHSIQLPGEAERPGIISTSTLWARWHKLEIPTDLDGKKILDVGCWDGWFTVTAAGFGGIVTAVDLIENKNMRYVANQLAPAVVYRICSVYDLHRLGESFDIVFCFGVLYHLRHPLLGLEAICRATKNTAYIETFVTDTEERRRSVPQLEFYETIELRGQFDNWCGPSISCVEAMLRSAGFARVIYLGNFGERAHFVAHRQISKDPSRSNISDIAARIWAITNAIDNGYILRSDTDGFACVWCEISGEYISEIDDISIRFGEFDALPVSITKMGERSYQLVCKVSPGIDSGIAVVHLRIKGYRASNNFRVMVDYAPSNMRNINEEPRKGSIRLVSIQDSKSGSVGTVTMNGLTYLIAWIEDRQHILHLQTTSIRLAGIDLLIEYLSEPDSQGLRQANCRMPLGFTCHENESMFVVEIFSGEVLEDVAQLVVYCSDSKQGGSE